MAGRQESLDIGIFRLVLLAQLWEQRQRQGLLRLAGVLERPVMSSGERLWTDPVTSLRLACP